MVIGEGVRKSFEDASTSRNGRVAIFTELGRYMLGPYGHLVTRQFMKRISIRNTLVLMHVL